eukprot:scaffold63268_cov34-Tisochrysis_lutea.AAC.3
MQSKYVVPRMVASQAIGGLSIRAQCFGASSTAASADTVLINLRACPSLRAESVRGACAVRASPNVCTGKGGLIDERGRGKCARARMLACARAEGGEEDVGKRKEGRWGQRTSRRAAGNIV